MKIICLNPDGINRYEKEANARMEKEFSSKWRGYSALELIDIREGTKEIDFILVTEDRVLLLELKSWNGVIRYESGTWVHNNENRSSPVKINANKVRILVSAFKRQIDQPPFVEHRVILCGNARLENFREDEAGYVIKLDDFLKIKDEKIYKKLFPKPTSTKINDLGWYDKFFNAKGTVFKPRQFSYHNYKIEGESTFKHPKEFYKEYRAVKKDDKNYQALLRRWDLTQIEQDASTQDERADIVLRENKVLGYIKSQKSEYKEYYLQPLTSATKEEVTVDFCELYELPQKQLRLNEFINKYHQKLQLQDRLDLIKILISRFADLHDIEVAHRDIGEHSLWMERPAKITISGFITAYFREVKTISGLRDVIKAGLTKTPEDTLGDGTSDPFRRDVFLLSISAYLIAYGTYPSQDDELYVWEKVKDDIFGNKLNSWFEKGMDWNAQHRFRNAREMLDFLNKITLTDYDEIDLKYFEDIKVEKSHYKIYSVIEDIKETSKYDIYLSSKDEQQVVVKVWHGIRPSINTPSINYYLYCFFERISSLRSTAEKYFPRIVDYGISTTGSYFVQEYIDGETLDIFIENNELTYEDKVKLSLDLIDAITYLHALGIYHGDLHPLNILIKSKEILQPIIIDTIEYYEGSSVPHNTAYTPTEYEYCQPIEIDNYATASLISDIFEITKEELESKNSTNNVYLTLSHFFSTPPYITIDKIKEALNETSAPSQQPVQYEVFLAKENTSLELLSDNGVYYVASELSKKNSENIIVWVTGVRKKLTLIVGKSDYILKGIKLEDITHQELQRTIKNRSNTIENSEIIITAHSVNNADALLTCLKVLLDVGELDPEQDEDITSIESSLYSYLESGQNFKTFSIWQTILSMEEELLPEVEITGSHEIIGKQLFIPYTSATLDFDNNDRVEVSIIDGENKRRIGWMNIRKSDKDILVIEDFKGVGHLKLGVKLKLLNQQTKSSYQRRKSAIERILNNKSVIRNLIDFFDPNVINDIHSIPYNILEEELDEYNLYDNDKLIYTLNSQQRLAFQQIFVTSPVSLLQGPPGTGKTAFIASFIHYLVKKGHARHILLVSQSHEAVNNAIEGINELSERTNLNLDIVRFGSEGMLSDSIRHLHISAIQYKYRETFKASIKSRVLSLSENLKLPKEFVENYFDLEFHLGSLQRDLNNIKSETESNHRKQQMLSRFYNIARKIFKYDGDQLPTDELIFILKNNIIYKYNINSSLAITKLDQIIKISFEWIDVLAIQRGNFDEFLGKTRTLVCGTCVGIGQWHMGIANNQYDWVIIDEAARATASELAIAMQTGKRILLVGDHLQLPPQYNPQDLLKHVSRRLGVDEELIKKSDFERAFQSEYGAKVGVTLTTQYRMASSIGALVSHCFYRNELKTGRGDPESYYQHLPTPLNTAQVIWIDTSSEASKSYETEVTKSGYYNSFEAEVVIDLLKSISNSEEFLLNIKNDLHNSEKMIGIICMYAEQKRIIIKKLMESDSIGLEFKKLIKVDTVDSYQGKENRLVILSLTRNNELYKQGFLNDAKRINVALSRAKNRLIIVGATKMWECKRNKNTALGSALNFIHNQVNSTDYAIYDSKHYYNSRT
jgi:serine/threonine protein kinase